MSDLPENPRPDRDFRRSSLSSSSGDVSVDLELQIEGEDRHAGESSAIRESVSDSHTDTGIIDRSLPRQNIVDVERLTADKSESASSQLTKTRGHGRNNFGILASKILDERVPTRKKEYGHRVRLATHSNFKEFVLAAGLEFFPLGGDPKVLASYMVKNKGFLPSERSEIQIQRRQIKEIIYSLLPACIAHDPDSKVEFKVDAIIANPPAYGHTHVAEALKVPIHIFFTMPWTPTSEFPHPLSRVKQQVGYRLSYQIVDTLIWLGIRDIINEFRKKKLKLRPVTYLSGSYTSPPDVTYGYLWSPHLVPKPKDWGPKIDVVGFCFLNLASNYVPPDSLVKWLEDGEKPIYIGFGSLPVQEPEKMTQIIVEALELTGRRGIINKGWGGLGNLAESKDFVYLLDNCPHDWLFLQCAAVVHHGGAGTTAAGLKAACPTTIVPFFGDQQFWGERVHTRGLGPAPIPVEEFSREKLINAIHFMQDPMVKHRAVEMAKALEHEDGATGAVNAFHKHFPRNRLLETYHDSDQSPPRSRALSFMQCFGCS
ncbi:sterol 3-beta-glucosyltransferase UGT80A2-like isoform X3 [Actinidia eriantha]|uniref:sterol 3-beta-glucosyltransferase UGT80A2-like isoform X3 n=1 Tax=Actinidia eriantha TaxID=165200 RepID=UPI002588239B|nr:sterol 3-beta-glucosyltransferase UGT80A2-like isoform X3 [Actinidia eriantha]